MEKKIFRVAMYKRKLEQVILEMLDDFRIVYIAGPRQAGKSTLSHIVAGQRRMEYYTLDDPALLASATEDPLGFLYALKKPCVLDEFQLSPGLIRAIKIISDQAAIDQKGIFLLTGSADIFKSAKTQEALPGHMIRVELYPLSFTEICDTDFNIIDFLFAAEMEYVKGRLINKYSMSDILLTGGYPEIIGKSIRSRSAWFKSYVNGRLFKDFESIYNAKGDYHAKLKSLIKYVAGLNGNLLKYSSIGNYLGIDDKTVKKYIEALELMFIVKRVAPFVKNRARRSVVGMSKIHFIDTGLATHLLGIKTPEVLFVSQFFGGLVENLVYTEILKQSPWSVEDIQLYHFRDKQKNEVDLVLERDDGRIVGVEVKSSVTVRKEDFKGLHALKKYAGKSFMRGVLLYCGENILPFTIENQTFHAVPISFLIPETAEIG